MPAWTFLADCMLKLLSHSDVRIVGAWLLDDWFLDWIDQERERRRLPLLVRYPSLEIAQRALLFQAKDVAVFVVEPLDNAPFGGIRLQRPSSAVQHLLYDLFSSDVVSESHSET